MTTRGAAFQQLREAGNGLLRGGQLPGGGFGGFGDSVGQLALPITPAQFHRPTAHCVATEPHRATRNVHRPGSGMGQPPCQSLSVGQRGLGRQTHGPNATRDAAHHAANGRL